MKRKKTAIGDKNDLDYLHLALQKKLNSNLSSKYLSTLEFIYHKICDYSSEGKLDKEIISLEPDIYVKAGDYDHDSIDRFEYNALLKVKSRIKFVSFLPERNTSSLINNIIAKHS